MRYEKTKTSTFDATDSVHDLHFYEYSELIEYCKLNKGVSSCGQRHSETFGGDYFYGTNDYEIALDFAENGQFDEIKAMKDAIDSVRVQAKAITFSPIYEVSGESVDVGRFLTGEPECMQEWEMVESKGNKVVDLYFHFGGTASVTVEEKRNYGACILSIVDFLESSNCRVNLFLYCSNTFSGHGRKVITDVIKMKKANEALNIPILSFAMTNAAMFRRLLFKVFENNRDGYGCTCDISKEMLVGKDNNEAVVFPSVEHIRQNFKDSQKTIEYLKNKLPEILNEIQIDNTTIYNYNE